MVKVHDEDQGDLEIHESMVDLRDDPPTQAELYMATSFGPRGPDGKHPEARYRARCPEGHDLGEMQPTVRDVYCDKCSKRYEVRLRDYRL